MNRTSRRALTGLLVVAAAVPAVAAAEPRAPAPAIVVQPAAAPDRPSGQGSASGPLSAQDLALAAYRRMVPAQRVGQLLDVGIPGRGATAKQLAIVRRNHVGNLFLVKNSDAGVTATRAVVGDVRPAATQAGVRPLVGTDQEGGYVQRLTGPGFSAIPTALTQGQWPVATLRNRATRWGRQLARAGVDLDAAPVADVVPAQHAHANAPIGRYDREYGHTPLRVARHVTAFAAGLTAAGVLPVVKHFPGLGRATGNTDDTSGVTDPTTRDDPYLRPFRAAIAAGVPIVMVSSATYPAIDPHHIAAFSSTVVRGLLRGDLGFRGVVVSDSLTTIPFERLPPGSLALRFLRAGGDLLLIPEAHATHAMRTAILQRAATHPAFARTVKAAVLAVLRCKARAGLVAAH